MLIRVGNAFFARYIIDRLDLHGRVGMVRGRPCKAVENYGKL